jgi:hypothetical protein
VKDSPRTGAGADVGAGGGAGGGGASSFPIEEVAVASLRPPSPSEVEAVVSGCVLQVVLLGLVATFVGWSPASLVTGPAAATFVVLVAPPLLVFLSAPWAAISPFPLISFFLTFALLVIAVAAVAVAVALVVLVALILAPVFTLLFGPACGYVRLVLARARRELGWGRWKETSSSRTRVHWRCHGDTALIQQMFCPVFRSFVSKLDLKLNKKICLTFEGERVCQP